MPSTDLRRCPKKTAGRMIRQRISEEERGINTTPWETHPNHTEGGRALVRKGADTAWARMEADTASARKPWALACTS